MTDKLPQNLRALFAPRPPLRFLPAHDHTPEDRHTARISGVAQFLPYLNEKAEVARKSDAGELAKDDADFEPPPTVSELEKRDNEIREKQEQQKWLTTEGVKKLYQPAEDAQVRGDPFKTLFISRLSYDVDTKDLEREFSRYGPIERIRIVADNGEKWKELKERGVDMKKVSKKKKQGASRGYAFIVFEREDDMKGLCINALIWINLADRSNSCLQRDRRSVDKRSPHPCRRRTRSYSVWLEATTLRWRAGRATLHQDCAPSRRVWFRPTRWSWTIPWGLPWWIQRRRRVPRRSWWWVQRRSWRHRILQWRA